MHQVTRQVLYLVGCALSLDCDVCKDRKWVSPSSGYPALDTQLGASICHSIDARHTLCSISFSTIFSLSPSLPLSLSFSLSQDLFISLSLPSSFLSPSLPFSFLSLGSTRVPYQICMHLSWPARFILSLPRIISGPYVRATLSCAVDPFAHGLRYGRSLDHFSSLP